MKKIVLQLIVTITLFFCCWFVLSRVDWLGLMEVQPAELGLEEKLGELYWDSIREEEGELVNDSLVQSVTAILHHICLENDIDSTTVNLHFIKSNEVNAYALPGRYMVVCKGLLDEVENDAELAGVLGHELAHIEQNHVMKKLIKEVGLAVLIGLTTDQANGQIIRENLPVLTATAYDRHLEEEADIKSVDYLRNADIDPEPFADLLYRYALSKESMPEAFSWISSHPASKERAEKIIEYIAETKQ